MKQNTHHLRRSKKEDKNIFLVDSRCHPQSIAVVKTRAEYLHVEIVVQDHREFDFSSGCVCGVLLQYPNTDGQINDFTETIAQAHSNQVFLEGGCLCVCVGEGMCMCVCVCVGMCMCVCACV